MESEIAKSLDYSFTVPTIHSFLCRHLKAAHADRTMVQLTCYLAESSLLEYSMIQYCPSLIAATSVMIARKSLERHAWSPTLVKYTTYDESDLEECCDAMNMYVHNDVSEHSAVRDKYSSKRFGSVSETHLVM